MLWRLCYSLSAARSIYAQSITTFVFQEHAMDKVRAQSVTTLVFQQVTRAYVRKFSKPTLTCKKGIAVNACLLQNSYRQALFRNVSRSRSASEHERSYALALAMDALVCYCFWIWMRWSRCALGTCTSLWFGHGCSDHRRFWEYRMLRFGCANSLH